MAGDSSDKRELYQQLEELAGEGNEVEISAEFLSSVLTHIPAVISALAPDGRLLFLNRTMTGAPIETLLGRPIYDFIRDPEERELIRRTIAGIVATGEPDSYVVHALGIHGPRSEYQNWLGPIRSGGKVIALTCITRDVTEQSRAQHALADREARLSLALASAGMGSWRWDPATHQTELDESARKIWGVAQEHLTTEDVEGLVHPDDLPSLRAAAAESFLTRTPYAMEHRVPRADGTIQWLAAHGLPLYDDEGNVEALLGTIVDITERRAVDEQLRQSQKLDAVGQLTAGVAHNFNNMLASILPALERIRGDVSPANVKLVEAATEATERAASMVRELTTFSGKNQPRARQRLHVGHIIEQTVQLCRTSFDRGIDIRLEIADDLPLIAADAAQLEQALLNMLINARDALATTAPSAPAVTIRAAASAAPPEGPSAGDGRRWVCISITDNAGGMTESVRSRIFEPFFTTKEVGRGTGLGLSTSYAIVREHGGVLRCESEPGKGSAFTLWLPPSQSEAPTTALGARSPGHRAPPRGKSILLVDDEAVIRRVLGQVLKHAGYEVRAAAHGEDALADLERNGGVDLFILDRNMPGMPFSEFVTRLEDVAPEARRIVYTGEAGGQQIDGVDAVILKPTPSDLILEVIATLLAADG